MKPNRLLRDIPILLISVFPAAAFAHPDHEIASFTAGFMHPLTGLDHLLVMLAVGLWAGKLGSDRLKAVPSGVVGINSKIRWQLPLTFMAMMAIGGLLGMSSLIIPGLETGIAASVLAMGLLLALNMSLNPVWQGLLIAIFALFHGFAHGSELNSYNGYSAMAGMLLVTGLLHGIGLLSAMLGIHSLSIKLVQFLQRSVGGFIAITGLYLIMA